MSSRSEVGEPVHDRLVRSARAARSQAYAPYSGFTVGAAVLAGGQIYAGANIENASYSVAICAERVAGSAAVAAGNRSLEAVAVVGPTSDAVMPCGTCRQFLSEFNPDLVVISEGGEGKRVVERLSGLLPLAFGPADLADR